MAFRSPPGPDPVRRSDAMAGSIHKEYHRVVISPVGKWDDPLLQLLSARVESVFGFRSETIPLLESIDFALDPVRRQYHSTPILEKLSDAAPVQAVKVLCLVQEDLFIPILTHVYGEAQLGGRACMVSTHRLGEGLPSTGLGRVAYEERIVKEAIHELGHTFNLRHCPDAACIMHYCHTVQDVDRKTKDLCRYCTVLLKDELGR
ncbi:MAG: Zn-dependent protease [Deltaproteobacteria bacterium]|nr:Zn-dependent protease [Deltaproteobacteria bacterium]